MNPKLPDILKPHPGCLSDSELFLYVEGKLSAAAARRVEEHFSDCEFCSDALDGIMENGIERSKTTLSSIRKEMEGKTVKRKVIPLSRRWQVAAAIILIAASAWFVNLVIQRQAEQVFTDQFEPYPPTKDEIKNEVPPPVLSDGKGQTLQQSNSPAKDLAEKSGTTAKTKEVAPAIAMDSALSYSDAAQEPDPNVEKAEEITISSAFKKEDVDAKKSSSLTESKNFSTSPQDGYLSETVESKAGVPQAMNDFYNVHSDSVVEHTKVAMKLYENKQYPEAIAEFDKVLKAEPSNASANFYSGVSALALNKPDDALSFFRNADDKSGAFYEATLWYQALSYISKKDKKKAQNLLEKVIKLNGEYRLKAEETLKEL